jgi:plastocyanin
MPTTYHERSVIRAMYASLALTVVATIVPYVDRATGNVLADHVRAGYPTYIQARIDSAVTTYLVYLSVVGALGIISCLGTIWAVKAGKRWVRGAATAMFALGIGIALTGLLVKDTSGDIGLPPLLGWVGMFLCLVGLLAVTLLWRRSAVRRLPVMLVPLALAAALVLAGCGGDEGGGAAAAAADPVTGVTEVVAKDSRFSAAAIQVPAGGEVTWAFRDGLVPHNVVGDGWGSGEPQRSGTFRHTFEQPGTYPYRCTLHDGMDGRVVVTRS